MKLKALAQVCIAFLGLGCSSVVKMPERAVDYDQAKTAWSQVLAKHVDSEGWVDFQALQKNPESLNTYLAFVRSSGPANRPELFTDSSEALAFHINAYNALSIYGVLEAGIPNSNSGFSKVTFFMLKKYQIAGVVRSLKDYEDNVIRKIGDPRIHWALNCMAVSCPKLPQVPFEGQKINQQLDQASRFFFSEKRNLRIDHDKKEVWVSEILKFFPEDFLAVSPSVVDYINKWSPEKIPQDYRVKYIPYDWTIINQAKKPTMRAN